MKYLPLFHHFKAIYQFPKHIIFLVNIVANASLSNVLISIMFSSCSTTPIYVDDINLYQTADVTMVDCSSLIGQTTSTVLSVLPRSSQVGDNKFIKQFLVKYCTQLQSI